MPYVRVDVEFIPCWRKCRERGTGGTCGLGNGVVWEKAARVGKKDVLILLVWRLFGGRKYLLSDRGGTANLNVAVSSTSNLGCEDIPRESSIEAGEIPPGDT